MPPRKHTIAMHFGNNRCGCNGAAACVAVNQRELFDGQIKLESINQQVIGLDGKRFHGAAHRQPGCLINIDLVDLKCVRTSHGPAEGARFNLCRKSLTLRRVDNLAITKAANRPVRMQHDRGREYRSEKAAPADLVNPSDVGEAAFASFAFVRTNAADGPRLNVPGGTPGAPALVVTTLGHNG